MPMGAVAQPFDSETDAEGTEFFLGAEEVEKGSQVIASYLASIKVAEHRRAAEAALDKVSLLITQGRCEAAEFPWHQMEGHHGATAIALLKEEGVPQVIEGYLCARDQDRKSPRIPKTYPSREIQKFRNALRKILDESDALGHANSEFPGRSASLLTPSKNTVLRGRMLSAGEFRSLLAGCQRDRSAAGQRDALILYLGYECGLRLGEMVAVSLGDIVFDKRSSRMAVKVRASRTVKARTVPLSNNAMIVLEDWLERRGREDGPLLCEIGRAGRVERVRLKGVDLRSVCTRRAQEAGVELFSPQDLRRRVAAGDVVQAKETGSSLVFGDVVAEADDEVDKISFPYPIRTAE